MPRDSSIRRCVPIVRDTKGRFAAREPADAEHVRQAAVPPAYTDVCVNADRAHRLYWTARDKAGRTQYRYTRAWRAGANARKFARLADVGGAMREVRARVASDLREAPPRPAGPGATQRAGWVGDREVAAIVGILDLCRMRAGSRRYLKRSGARGATTVEPSHLRGHRLEWPAKSGQKRACDLSSGDPALARALPGALGRVSAARLNDWLRPYGVTAKDVRTWHANALYVAALRRGAKPADCIRAAAAGLGHTPSVCRLNYLDPRVMAAKAPGDLPQPPARVPARLSVDEAVLLRLLATA